MTICHSLCLNKVTVIRLPPVVNTPLPLSTRPEKRIHSRHHSQPPLSTAILFPSATADQVTAQQAAVGSRPSHTTVSAASATRLLTRVGSGMRLQRSIGNHSARGGSRKSQSRQPKWSSDSSFRTAPGAASCPRSTVSHPTVRSHNRRRNTAKHISATVQLPRQPQKEANASPRSILYPSPCLPVPWECGSPTLDSKHSPQPTGRR